MRFLKSGVNVMALEYLKTSTGISQEAGLGCTVAQSAPSKSNYTIKLLFLFILLAVTLYCSYLLWRPSIKKHFKGGVVFGSLQVTGIMYNEDNPVAFINGQIVKQGDVIRGYTVSCIEKDCVELRKGEKVHYSKMSSAPEGNSKH
ncbi:MAG: hypothetical protein WDA68_03755 [Phycisphaerae bacterium]